MLNLRARPEAFNDLIGYPVRCPVCITAPLMLKVVIPHCTDDGGEINLICTDCGKELDLTLSC